MVRCCVSRVFEFFFFFRFSISRLHIHAPTFSGTKETRTSSLIAYGDPDGDTSMAKTVGITAAIGAQLLLNGDIRDRGVLVPTKPSVYVPGLRMLKEEGFEFKEE
jgi:alpha-aminoadipic semialdehyde synthase